MEKEQVNHPSHYGHGIEPIEVIESWDLNFNLGKKKKKKKRTPKKQNMKPHQEKDKWYLERELKKKKK